MILASVAADVSVWFRTPDNWWGATGIFQRLSQHAQMSFAALLAVVVATVPITLWLGHQRRFGVLAINVSNAGRAIPSFAILVVGTQLFGLQDVAVIGSWFVFAALIVLAAPSIVTNTWVGVAEVPDEVSDAARGMGLTETQILWRIELPLALPLIMGGIRTAAILVVSTATIAAQVGSGGLGRFIVEGFALGPDAYDEVVAGAILVALFALATEACFAWLQRAVTPAALRPARPTRPKRSHTNHETILNPKEGPMSPITTNEKTPQPLLRRRPLRLLGAVGLAGALLISSACASSSDDTTTAIKFRSLDAGGPQTIGALKNGSIDIAELFTFTPDIAKNNWVTLEDDKHLQAADNFVPLINASKNTPQIAAVIDAVTAKLNHDDLMAMVKKVSVDGADPEDVAEDWLEANKLPGTLKATGKLTIGSANFAESEIVGRLYDEALDDAGVDTTFKDSVGNRQVTMPMMEKGDLDLMPEFTYSLLAYLDSNAKPSNDLDTVVTQLKAALPSSLMILTPSDVSDVNVFVVTQATAKKHNLAKISDLANVTTALTLGGPPECPKNAACIPGLEKVYGLRFNIK